jgi:RNA polymerase sigma-70 factor (ECF subfamily)
VSQRETPRGRMIPLRRVEGRADEMSDEALLAACAGGEAAALGALFDRHAARTERFLRRVARRGSPDVADLLQATFLEAQRSARQFRGQSTVATWIMGIAANIASHHARGEQRRQRMEAVLAAAPEARVKTPGEEAERLQLLARLSAGIAELPPELRVPYVLCELEDLTGKEAARALEISEGLLWRRLHDAKVFLRRVIERRDK